MRPYREQIYPVRTWVVNMLVNEAANVPAECMRVNYLVS